MQAPVFALKQLGFAVRHHWSSDIDEAAKAFSLANCAWSPNKCVDILLLLMQFVDSHAGKPQVYAKDVATSHEVVLTEGLLDVYIAGFPCQSYSSLGLRRGLKDREKAGVLRLVCAILQSTIEFL